MVVHGVGAADADHQGLLDAGPVRDLQVRQPPGDRQRGPGQDGEAEAASVLDHLPGVVEAVGEVLVVVDRHRPPVGLEDGHALLEHLVPRVELLAQLVVRVLAVLADDQHPVHGQLTAAAAQGLGHRGVHLEAELPRPVRALIALGGLVDVEGDDPPRGTAPFALVRIADEKAVGEVLGVGQVAVDGGHHRQPHVAVVGHARPHVRQKVDSGFGW